jgi:hypothetical protein
MSVVELIFKAFFAVVIIGSLLPLILAPILPKRFKAKAVIELDCTVEKAFDTLVEDVRKAPMTAKDNSGIAASRDDADSKGRPLKWKEETSKGRVKEVYSIEQTFKYKPSKTARIVRTSKHDEMPIESEWTYEIEPLGKDRCRVTLEGYTDVKDGKTQVHFYRLMYLMQGPKVIMIDHLNMMADATGAKRTWIA